MIYNGAKENLHWLTYKLLPAPFQQRIRATEGTMRASTLVIYIFGDFQNLLYHWRFKYLLEEDGGSMLTISLDQILNLI